MAGAPRDSFERTFPRREWVAGLGRWAVIWSAISGVLLALVIVESGLLIDLLVHGGALDVTLRGKDIARFEKLTGIVDTTPGGQPSASSSSTPLAPGNVPATTPASESGSATSTPVDPDEDAEPPLAPVPDAGPVPVGGEDTEFVREPEVVRHFEDFGLLPSVWRGRDVWWQPPVAWAYRNIPTLRQNLSALLTMLCLLAVTWMLRAWSLAHLRNICRQTALEVSSRLRRQLHRQSMRLATEDLDGTRIKDAMTLFVDETDRVRNGLFEWLYHGTRFPVELVFVAIAAMSVEVLLTAQWVLLSLLGWFLISRGQSRAEQTRRIAADRADRELRSLGESLRAARLVRGYGMETQEQEEFGRRLDGYVKAVTVQNRVVDDPLWLRLVISVTVALLAAFLLFILGTKVLSGEVVPAGGAEFVFAFGLGLMAVQRIRGLSALRTFVSASASRIWRYLDELPTVSQAVGAKFLNPLSKSLHFVGVSYKTPEGRLLLDRVEIALPALKCYAVVSLDPLEARAFAFMLLRFIEPQSGRVLFDGEDIAWGTLESLRNEVAFVSNDDPMLAGTVMDNIRAGRAEASTPQIIEAAKEARAHNFISRLAQGYETPLDTVDAHLDAGQRLRLSLARALLRKPAVLIVEEPDVPLDEDTKQLLDDTYGRICGERTVIFLPNRLSTLRRADEILVLRHGQIEAMGPHALLVKESSLYRHWEYLHFHEFRHDA